MNYISNIKLPDNSVYAIRDAEAQSALAALKNNFFTITDSVDDIIVETTRKTASDSDVYGANYAPYAPNNTFINYTIKKSGVTWVEGAVYCFVFPEDFNTLTDDTKPTKTKTNCRVRIYNDNKSTYYPLMKDENTIFNMYTDYNPARDKFFIFKKKPNAGDLTENGALYLLKDYVGSTSASLPEDGEVGQILTKTETGYEWATIETDDTKVTQTASTENSPLPVLIAKNNTTATDTTLFNANVTINPSNGEMNATQFALNGRTIILTETETGGWIWN